MNQQNLEQLYTPAPDDILATGIATSRQQRAVQSARQELAAARELGCDLVGSNLSLNGNEPREELIAWLAAQGRTRKQIAELVGVPYTLVVTCFQKPTFRLRVRDIIQQSGKDAVTAMLEAEVMPSLDTLVEIRDNREEKGATRVTAANSILDRFLGKPTVKVESETKVTTADASREIDALQQELATVNDQLKALGVPQEN